MRKVISVGQRASLTLKDLEFITTTLASGQSEQLSLTQLLKDPDARDEILDHPQLYDAIQHKPQNIDISDHLFFYILIRRQLLKHSIDGRDLAEYVSSILAKQNQTRCWQEDETSPFGIPYEEVALRKQIESTRRYDHLFIYAHAAECNLVAVSIYHQYLNRRVKRFGAPSVSFYESCSLNQFREARKHPLAVEFGMNRIYDSVVSNFETITQSIRSLSHQI